MAEMKEIGKVTHYFTRIGVAGVELSDELRVGDTIHILGHTTDFEQKVTSMQLEHRSIEAAQPGQLIGIKVRERARPGDIVYKVE